MTFSPPPTVSPGSDRPVAPPPAPPAAPSRSHPEKTAPARRSAPAPPVNAPPVAIDPSPAGTIPSKASPAAEIPTDTIPQDVIPRDVIPRDVIPQDTIPRDTLPTETLPTETLPPRAAPDAKSGDRAGADRAGADRLSTDGVGADRASADRGSADRPSPDRAPTPQPDLQRPPLENPEADPGDEPAIALDPRTLTLAAEDVRRVMQAQDEQGQTLTTKLNILFVTNGALLTSVSISRLMAFPSRFSLIFNVIEVTSFFLSFSLLISAFFPRQVVVSPNLQDQKFLERYLPLQWEEYQLQMLVNLVETYNANRQRLDDVSQSLRYAAYATWIIAGVILCHMVVAYSFS